MDMIWAVIGWAVLGLCAGAIARLLHPGRDPMTWLGTMVLGILGSLVGGFVVYLLHWGDKPYSPANWIGSIIAAILLLIIHNRMTAPAAAARTSPGGATNADYKRAVYDDLSKGSQ